MTLDPLIPTPPPPLPTSSTSSSSCSTFFADVLPSLSHAHSHAHSNLHPHSNLHSNPHSPLSHSPLSHSPLSPHSIPTHPSNLHPQNPHAQAQAPIRSRAAMRDWIQEEYEATGLSRKLNGLDMQALLSQAGFDLSSADHAVISRFQWDEFRHQFRSVLSLLRQIATVWNLEDPCAISGFDMDRVGTVNALVNEPNGTFICRFSMSQPGCLVLSCKVGKFHPRSDSEGLLHAIIRIDDLYERRVDTWIRDFAGATHVLDVYRQKR
eukprot:CAMPEP_0175065646 /NCGR_PEP_ID=MMETSP0052_2-20121109/16053_1 /TAXON_ID=51329 ORGANISM="Polytomella parva, Strain SAG 63-3" /NCGR_SAMPLE_ID=MMETSP0052_2 /ASSEMBLY_ACC=CAM_ASM_000194 /LENGTH=264 /DNA_ID=CAMNT_0016332229 /DNA_START=136 /DNA_END=926 /DNA_ORIENTATION=+